MTIQEYLSLGYVYLVVLGVVKDTIFYSLLGVNILEYSSVMDILLSPIVELSNEPVVLIFFLLIVFAMVILPRLKKKEWYQKVFNQKEGGEEETSFGVHQLKMLAVLVACFFMGTGVGGGFKFSKKLKNKEFEMADKLVLIDDTAIDTRIISQNSSYVFYVEKDKSEITVSPIAGVVKKIYRVKK